jgi:CHAD domain-containing protein
MGQVPQVVMADAVATSHPEIEVKLEVHPDAVLPDLTGLPGVATVDPAHQHRHVAVYLDTVDLRLARAGTTLRRRTGGTDAGWHLKIPVSAQERVELRAPLGPEDGPIPPELTAAVRARVRGAALAPVAVIRTRRTVHRLRDRAGRILAEVADDAVTSHAPGAAAATLDQWHEWEIELVDGDRDLLAATLALLQRAGGSTPGWASKLHRALGDRLDRNHLADRHPGAAPNGSESGAAVLRAHLRAQRDELLDRDPQTRRDVPDGVHQMRVATRRLRSALQTFGPLLDRTRTEPLRAELGWLAGLLGLARDAEVARDELANLIAHEPPDLVLGPVADRLDADRAAFYRSAREQVLAALDSERYFRLLDALDAVVDAPAGAPAYADASAEAAARVLPHRVRHEFARLTRAVSAAVDERPGSKRDELLHEARKAAKGTRYAAEVAALVVGRPASRFARASEALQTLLGDHHDTVELRAILVRVGGEAHLHGESTFTYGRLHAIEQARAERTEADLPAAWHRLSTRDRSWMR